jgi:shikimate kinase
MGVGKSTVGSILAPRLGLPFVDLDDRIVQREGRPVRDILEQEGELTFRRLEAEALDLVLAGPRVVLSCGGGAPCQRGAMDQLKQFGKVVHLFASTEVLQGRVGGAQGRPLWDENVDALRASRQAHYERAHHQVDVTGTVEEVVEEIWEWLGA